MARVDLEHRVLELAKRWQDLYSKGELVSVVIKREKFDKDVHHPLTPFMEAAAERLVGSEYEYELHQILGSEPMLIIGRRKTYLKEEW